MKKEDMPVANALEVFEKLSHEINTGTITAETLLEIEASKDVITKLLMAEKKREIKRVEKSHLQFTLSMPRVNSWNNTWSGEGNLYAVVHPILTKIGKERAKEILKIKSFHYDFGDGWTMRISVQEINKDDAKKVKKDSKGFMGYEWAVESIIHSLKIQTN